MSRTCSLESVGTTDSSRMHNNLERAQTIMDNEFAHLNTTVEKLDWATQRMMGMQADADATPEIIADYAWLRDDEIQAISQDLFDSIRDDTEALREVSSRCSDKRWPVRIMMCFTKALLENTSLYKDYKNSEEWFDNFREFDPDPTEP